MADTPLSLEPRQAGKTKHARAVRASGKIPGVLYGHGYRDPVPFQIDAPALRDALSGEAGRHAVLRVAVAGVKGDAHAVVKDYQLDPVRDRLVHIDLLAISMTEPIIAAVTVRLDGEPIGVREGGVLDQALYEAQVRALPGDLPNELVVNVDALAIGHSIKVSEVALPAGVTLVSDPDMAVAMVVPPRAIEVEEEPAEAEEAEGEPDAEAEGEDSST
jgi:large subunit ribosomal protein L25